MSRKSSFPITRVGNRDGSKAVLTARDTKVSLVEHDWQASLIVTVGNKVDGFTTYNARVEGGINLEHLDRNEQAMDQARLIVDMVRWHHETKTKPTQYLDSVDVSTSLRKFTFPLPLGRPNAAGVQRQQYLILDELNTVSRFAA